MCAVFSICIVPEASLATRQALLPLPLFMAILMNSCQVVTHLHRTMSHVLFQLLHGQVCKQRTCGEGGHADCGAHVYLSADGIALGLRKQISELRQGDSQSSCRAVLLTQASVCMCVYAAGAGL